jgi:hypothetical protein
MSLCVEDGSFGLVILSIMIKNFKTEVVDVNISIVNSITGCLKGRSTIINFFEYLKKR